MCDSTYAGTIQNDHDNFVCPSAFWECSPILLHGSRSQNLKFVLQNHDLLTHLRCFLCARLNQVHHLVAIILHDVVNLSKVFPSEMTETFQNNKIYNRFNSTPEYILKQNLQSAN